MDPVKSVRVHNKESQSSVKTHEFVKDGIRLFGPQDYCICRKQCLYIFFESTVMLAKSLTKIYLGKRPLVKSVVFTKL